MSLLSVPDEVVDTFLLPHLGWNDLLRLRRTCEKFKNLVNDYIRKHPEIAPELEIDEKEKNFRAFLAMGIPSKKIFLNNQSGNQFYNKAPTFVAKFLQDYGPLVTHLRLDKFSVWCTAKGKQFLEGFPNLISFQAAQTSLKRGGFGENPNRNRTNLPTVFERLQVLKLYQTKPDIRSGVTEVLEELLRRCRSLERFCIPFPVHCDGYIYSLNEVGLSMFFGFLEWTIRQRHGEAEAAAAGQGPLSRFKGIEFSDYPDRLSGAMVGWQREQRPNNAQEAFHRLASICNENNVKLVNVRGQWWSEALLRERLFDRQLRQLGTPLVSLTSDNFPVCMTRLNMPNLERLKLTSSSGASWNQRRPRPCNLPRLKSLDLVFNTGPQDSEVMCRYFFEGVVHLELTELRLEISMSPEPERVLVGHLAERLVASCPRLKKLTFSWLNGNCDALVAMLEGFETLEEINFVCCRQLKNADFLGPDAENPRFLRLTSLRKLSFTDLDYMPNLTDVLFSAVIRRMRLTHLTMTSSDPIRSVTLQGIENLLTGPFSESIEKFSFEEWSLDQVSPEEFQALEKKFRCKNIV